MYKLTILHDCKSTEYSCKQICDVRNKINETLFSGIPIASMSTVQNLVSRPQRVKVCWRENVAIRKLKRTITFVDTPSFRARAFVDTAGLKSNTSDGD
jgi:hypothetical protein